MSQISFVWLVNFTVQLHSTQDGKVKISKTEYDSVKLVFLQYLTLLVQRHEGIRPVNKQAAETPRAPLPRSLPPARSNSRQKQLDVWQKK